MDELITVVALFALAKKFVDFSKFVTNRDVNGAFTQLWAWAAGVGAVLVFAATDFAEGIQVGTHALGDLAFWSLVWLGLGIGSVGGVVTDAIKSFDNTDSAAMPKLLPGAADGPPPVA
jgi:hypothetical protein